MLLYTTLNGSSKQSHSRLKLIFLVLLYWDFAVLFFFFCFLTSPSAGKDTLPALAASAIRAYKPNSSRRLCKGEVPDRGGQQTNVLLMAILEHTVHRGGWSGWSWCAVLECLTLQQGTFTNMSRDGNSSSSVCLCTPLLKVEQSIWTKVYFNWA